MQHITSFFLKLKSDLLVNRVFFLLNAAFAMAILDLISQVHLPSFFNTLPKYLKHSTFSSCFCSIIIVTGDGCIHIYIYICIYIYIQIYTYINGYNKRNVIDGYTIYSLVLMLLYHLHKQTDANPRITYTNVQIFSKNILEYLIQFFNSRSILGNSD